MNKSINLHFHSKNNKKRIRIYRFCRTGSRNARNESTFVTCCGFYCAKGIICNGVVVVVCEHSIYPHSTTFANNQYMIFFYVCFPPTSVPFHIDIRTCHRVNDTPTTSDQKQPIGGPNVPSRFFFMKYACIACLHPSLLSYVLYLDTEMPTHFKKYKILFPLSLYLSNQFTQNPTVFDGRDV